MALGFYIQLGLGQPVIDSIINLLVKFIPFHKWFPNNHLKLVPHEETLVDRISSPDNLNSSNSQAIRQMTSKNITQEVALSSDDIEMVISALGLGGSSEKTEKQRKKKQTEDDLLEAASFLLEEKEASMDELNRAFSIFDANGDGFIDAVELQRVMAMLGFKEGMKFEDCDKMIRAYDKNGDGRIEFREFKNMLEDAN